jgi:hypothetical protein
MDDVLPGKGGRERKREQRVREDNERLRFLKHRDRLIRAELDKQSARLRGTVY